MLHIYILERYKLHTVFYSVLMRHFYNFHLDISYNHLYKMLMYHINRQMMSFYYLGKCV